MAALGRGMLHPMPQATESAPSPTSPSFAGLLAALTAPAPKTAWNNDDLADDVATLSYEHALRTHARYKPADSSDRAIAQAAEPETAPPRETIQDDLTLAGKAPSLWMPPGWDEEAEPQSARGLSTMLERNLKRASITIRLSKPECEQLRKRAAAAGLTVSAYLRSCTFEAEALRAQVKETLAELRKSAVPEKQHEQSAASHTMGRRSSALRSLFEWFLRFVPHWQDQRAARA